MNKVEIELLKTFPTECETITEDFLQKKKNEAYALGTEHTRLSDRLKEIEGEAAVLSTEIGIIKKVLEDVSMKK